MSTAEVATDNYLTHERGLLSWLTTLDHKRIGILYLISIVGAFVLGGIFAMVVRVEHMSGDPTIVDAETYNQAFTLHGAVMIFLFIIPGVPAALGNFVLPLMVGAKDVAFPRLNLMSWYCYVAGALLAVLSIVLGAVDTGWTFYAPYSTQTSKAVVPLTAGAFILGFSSILTGLNFVVTMHKMRPKGMTWFRMPLFLWGLYATAIIQILATPVLAITLLLLIVERVFEIGIFIPELGGDPVLFQHFFWFYSHPAVYVMILPAMGIMSELISTHSRKHIFGYKFIAYSSIAIAFFSFLVWGHHMFVSGQSNTVNVVFSLLTFSVAIPSAVKVFNWLATMYRGAIRLTTAMCYALAFLFLFGIGGLTGLFLGALATDVHLHDTYFIVAHFHYTMFGGVVIAFFGGLYHWWPKMFGRMVNETWGRIGCVLMFVGFNFTFIPQFMMGAMGMPRRYFKYAERFETYHVMSSIGSFLMGVSMLVVAANLLHSLFRGKKAANNPWGGASFEWMTTSPPPHENFEVCPDPDESYDPYDYTSLEYDPEIDGWKHDPEPEWVTAMNAGSGKD